MSITGKSEFGLSVIFYLIVSFLFPHFSTNKPDGWEKN